MFHREDKAKKTVTVSVQPRASSLDSSSDGSSTLAPSLKSPRMARFAEATTIESPIEPPKVRSPFAESLTTHYMAEAQPADVGFGYLRAKHESVEMPKTPKNGQYPATPRSPLKSPLKSAMKTPGAPPKNLSTAILTPAFHEEYLEKREKHTTKEQARDVKIKARVRIAKFLLRGVNLSCSLIIVAMLTTTLNIFRSTVDLPPRGGFTPWAPKQKIWPQVVVLSISCVSLFCAILVMYGYWKGGHKKASYMGRYYTAFFVIFFLSSIIVWAIGAGVLQHSRTSKDGKGMWAWSCKNNTRAVLFQNSVSYGLLCRLQNWSLICIIIEIVVETISILVYGIIFYRLYSKRSLHKSMAHRDRARSDLCLSQLKAQSAPPTPGFNIPYSPREGPLATPTTMEYYQPELEAGHNTQYVSADQKYQPEPFRLQPPPIKIQNPTPKMEQVGFTPLQTTMSTPAAAATTSTATAAPTRTPSPYVEAQLSPFMPPEQPQETVQEHFGAAPGEQVYDFVAPPGAYEDMVSSPGPEQMRFGHAF